MGGQSWGDLIGKIASTVHLGDYRDETGKACAWHLNASHYLEQWGGKNLGRHDHFGATLIEPIFSGRSPIELLSILLDDSPRSGYEITREAPRRVCLQRPGRIPERVVSTDSSPEHPTLLVRHRPLFRVLGCWPEECHGSPRFLAG